MCHGDNSSAAHLGRALLSLVVVLLLAPCHAEPSVAADSSVCIGSGAFPSVTALEFCGNNGTVRLSCCNSEDDAVLRQLFEDIMSMLLDPNANSACSEIIKSIICMVAL